jgi:hypothetical protein
MREARTTREAHARRTAARAAASLVALVALSGCPLPQPVAEVARVDGGTVTPPRIALASVVPADTVIQVSLDCDPAPLFVLSADIIDDNVLENVDARWFVNYTPDTNGSRPLSREVLPAPGDANSTTRALTPLSFAPLDFGAAARTVHVVELVVSNGFFPENTPELAQPNRSTQPGFEAQVFRWVFQIVAEGGQCS